MLFDIGKQGDADYMVMECLEGELESLDFNEEMKKFDLLGLDEDDDLIELDEDEREDDK